MDSGKLVPDDIMIELVMNDATPMMEDGRNLLLDGFPRTLQQAMSLEKVAHIDTVINLNIPTETIVERIADRYVLISENMRSILPTYAYFDFSIFPFCF